MRIKVTGDTHGDKTRIEDYISLWNKTKDFDVLLVCGDFGFLWTGNMLEQDLLTKFEKECPFEIWFVDGNHENFPEIYKYPIEDWNSGKIHRIRKNIIHLMRGEIYTINDKKIFTFGGGYSIDKVWRQNYEARTGKAIWWEEEFPTQEEINNAMNNLKKNNWKVDYIFTHSAPTNILPMISEFFISNAKANVDIVNKTLEDIRQKTDFSHWFFGHYHGNKHFDNFSLLYETSVIIEL